MEFRIERIKHITLELERDINKRNNILQKYKRMKNTFGVIGKISAVLTTATGTGGIITASTVALLPVTIALDSVVVICGVTLLISTKLYDCLNNKIDKHRNIKLLAINKLKLINEILAEDNNIDQNEFITISTLYEEFHKLKLEIQTKYKSNIN